MQKRVRSKPRAGSNPPGASTSVEDYLKAVHYFQIQGGRATTRDLANMLNVRMASVTGMIKQLHADGLVDHKPYQGVVLTARGQTIALRVLRRHRLLELFLQRTLGLSWDEVHPEAERLEHAASDGLIERIDVFLGRPAFDPHGAPIPQSDGKPARLEGIALSDCPAGHRGRILHVSDKDPTLLRHVTDLGLRIGTQFRVVDKAPFEGPITLRLGRKQVVLGLQAAEKVLVSHDQKVPDV